MPSPSHPAAERAGDPKVPSSWQGWQSAAQGEYSSVLLNFPNISSSIMCYQCLTSLFGWMSGARVGSGPIVSQARHNRLVGDRNDEILFNNLCSATFGNIFYIIVTCARTQICACKLVHSTRQFLANEFQQAIFFEICGIFLHYE